jgi:hypothetical protein
MSSDNFHGSLSKRAEIDDFAHSFVRLILVD